MMKKNGFTLIELMIAMVVGIIIMAAIYALMNTSQESSVGVNRKIMTQQDARAALDLMAMEIRMASFNPTESFTVGGTVPACASMGGFAGGVAGRVGIQIAGQNALLIAMDLDGNGTFNGPNEYIYYAFAGDRITRNIRCGGNAAFLGGAGTGTTVVNNAATPVFQYFNAAGNDISATVRNTPDVIAGLGGIKDIRRIRITIVVDVETRGRAFNTNQRTYTTDILVRNHAISAKPM